MYRRNYTNVLFKAVLLYVMILALSLGVKDYFAIEISITELCVYDFILVIGACLIYCFPKIVLFCIASFAAAAAYMNYYHSQVLDKLLLNIRLFLQWLIAYTAGYTVYLEEYSVPFLISILIFSAILMTILVFSKLNKLVITAIGIIVFSFFWFAYVERAQLYMMIYVVPSLILYSYSLWEKKATPVSFYGNWIGSVSMLVGFSLTVMLMLPLNIRPVRVAWLNDFMLQSFPFIEQWKNNSDESYGYSFRFSLSNSVYKGKRLGGPVSFSGSRMLSLTGSLRNNLYLRGSVYDKYSGFNWSKSRKPSRLYEKDMPIEIPMGADFSEIKYEIRHERLSASTLFNALYPVKLEYDGEKVFINDDMEIYSKGIVGHETVYKITSKIPVISENDLKSDMPDDDVQADQYLKLPKNMPKRVGELAVELTQGKESAYDKAKAIEEYLRENYAYTLKPEKIPEGRDFVDYFLFEEKQGYCTYFASAMTVMLRSVGIPSRYVEGFLVEAEGSGTKTYNILDSNSHAWVEAYLGYGWLSFEPTPAYEEIAPWEPWEDDTIRDIQSKSDSLPSLSQNAVNNPHRQKELLEEDIYMDEGTGLREDNEGMLAKYVFIILLMLIALRAAYGIVRINAIGFAASKDSKKFANVFIKQVSWMLGKAYKEKKDGETFREFLFSAYDAFEMDKNESEFIVSTIEGIIYGKRTLNPDEAGKLKAFTKSLKENIIANLGNMKYIWNYYLGKP